MRTIIYIRTPYGDRPLRTCYFSLKEYDRLMKEFYQYQKFGVPTSGVYTEMVTTDGQQTVYLEFADIATIKGLAA